MKNFIYAVLLALLVSGCELLNRDVSPAPSPAGPPSPTAAVRYAALGASDAIGTGSSAPCMPFAACEAGMGYVPVLVRQLRATREVTVMNLGMPAAVLGPSSEALARQLGREVSGNLVERQAPFVPKDSTLVTVFAGVNDANVIAESIQKGAAGTDIPGYIESQARAFGADYARLITVVRGRAPNAFVIVSNVPNVSLMPYALRYPIGDRRVMQTLSVALSREANKQAGGGVAVLDAMCYPATYHGAHFSADGFHPNDAGYADIAARLKAIVDSGGAPPASTCSAMTAVN